MPTYEYECQKCGKVFDLFQNISAKPRTYCTCGERGRVKRLLGTGAGFIFKGSGFYSTDYRSESYKKGAASEKKSTSGDAGKGDKGAGKSKSPDKPAKKKEKA